MGAWTVSPSPVPISSIPSGLGGLIPSLGGLGVGQSLGPAPGQSLCSARGWIPAGVTHLQPGAPCSSCPGCLPPSNRTAWHSHCPPWHWDGLWMLLLPTGTGQCPGTASHSSCSAGGSPFPPALHPGQPLWAETLQGQLGLCTALIPGLPQLLPHLQPTGKGWLGHGWEQQELGLGRQQPGLAAPEAADVKIKGRSCPGSVWELLPHSALWLWFIRMWVLAQPP